MYPRNAQTDLKHFAWRVMPTIVLCQFIVGCEHPLAAQVNVPPSVSATPVVKTDGVRELHLSGSLSPERSISLSFAVMGIVEEVLVQEGEAVKRGQTLARLSPRSYQDAVGIAKAKADQAEDAYRRLEPMSRNKTLPEIKMVEIESGRQQARLALSLARKNLEDTVLQAPMAGVVARRSIEPGASASPVLPAITLFQTKTMLATASVPEIQVAKLKRGLPAKVTIPALQKTIKGVVREIAIMADPLTRTYDVKVALPNLDGELRGGMVANVQFQLDGSGTSLIVPPEAVRVDETGTPCVFVVAPNKKLQRRHVEVAGFIGEGTALAKGVSEGELVVTSGTPMLADGMAVCLTGQKGYMECP